MSRRLGSLRRLSSTRWEARWSADGQRVSRVIHARTKTEAERMLHRLIAEQRPATMTVAVMLNRWMAATAHSRAPRTRAAQVRIITQRVTPAIGSVALEGLKPTHLERLYASLAASGLAPGTVRNTHAVIAQALRWAVRVGLLASSPADRVTAPRQPRSLVRPPTTAQIAEAVRLLADHHDRRLVALVHLAIATGARRGELLALRWSDISIGPDGITRITITRTVAAVAGKQIVQPRTKTGRGRTVVIGAASQRMLSEYRSWLGDRGVWVFPHESGTGPESLTRVSTAWSRIAPQIGLDGCRFHDLRHYAASALLAAGLPLHDVQQQLGHSSASITLNVYGHLLEDRGAERAAVLEQALGR